MSDMRKPRVHEFITDEGRVIVWLVMYGGDGGMDVRIAAKSPLTGRWLMDGGVRRRPSVATLREARRTMIGGNGHRYRGHSNVTVVHDLSEHRAFTRALQTV